MRLKISNRNSNLGNIASKLVEPKALTQAGALFLLALAHESAKAKAFEPLNDVQQLLGERKPLPLSPDEGVVALHASFDDLMAAWTDTVPDGANLDEVFEAMARMSASDAHVLLAQSGINRAPVSDAAVDYIDPNRFTPLKEAESLQSVPAPVAAPAPLADEGALALKLDPELALDPNTLAATGAGPLLLPLPLLLGAGAVALAGGSGGGSGSGGSGGVATPVNNVALISNDPGKDSGKVSAATATANGKFTVQDADAGQAAMQTQTNIQGAYGKFNVSSDGTWTYALDPTLNAYKALPKDVEAVDSFTVKSIDGSAQKTAFIKVTGINEMPTVMAPLSVALNEGGTQLELNLLAGANDQDNGETASLSVIDSSFTYKIDGGVASASAPLGITHPSGSNVLSISPAHAAFDYLAAGESTQVLVSYLIKDVQNTTVAQTATVTINGTNDAPSFSVQGGGSSSVNLNEPNNAGTSLSANGLLTLRDVDTTDKVNVQVTSVTLSGSTGNLTADAVKGMLSLTNDQNNEASVLSTNNLGWAFNSGTESFKYLGQGQSLTLTYAIKATDNSSSPLSASQNIVLTINGVNDAPAITSITPSDTASRTISEFANTVGSTEKHIVGGVITISDLDSSAALGDLKITVANPLNPSYPGLFTVDKPDAAGRATWHYEIEDRYLDSLNGPLPASNGQAAVEAGKVTIDNTFTVNDNSGASNGIITGHVYVTLLGIDSV